MLDFKFSDAETDFCWSICPSQGIAWCLVHGRDLKTVSPLMNHTDCCCLIIIFFSKGVLVWIFKSTIANIVTLRAGLHVRAKPFTLFTEFMRK